MTVKFNITELYNIMDKLPRDTENFIRTTSFIKLIQERYGCTPLTIRNFILRNPGIFDVKHGRVRIPKPEVAINQERDQAEFNVWFKKNEQMLNQCSRFLMMQEPQTPAIENLLVIVASAREQLLDYSNSKLMDLLGTLRRDFNFELPRAGDVV